MKLRREFKQFSFVAGSVQKRSVGGARRRQRRFGQFVQRRGDGRAGCGFVVEPLAKQQRQPRQEQRLTARAGLTDTEREPCVEPVARGADVGRRRCGSGLGDAVALVALKPVPTIFLAYLVMIPLRGAKSFGS